MIGTPNILEARIAGAEMYPPVVKTRLIRSFKIIRTTLKVDNITFKYWKDKKIFFFVGALTFSLNK